MNNVLEILDGSMGAEKHCILPEIADGFPEEGPFQTSLEGWDGVWQAHKDRRCASLRGQCVQQWEAPESSGTANVLAGQKGRLQVTGGRELGPETEVETRSLKTLYVILRRLSFILEAVEHTPFICQLCARHWSKCKQIQQWASHSWPLPSGSLASSREDKVT